MVGNEGITLTDLPEMTGFMKTIYRLLEATLETHLALCSAYSDPYSLTSASVFSPFHPGEIGVAFSQRPLHLHHLRSISDLDNRSDLEETTMYKLSTLLTISTNSHL